MVQVWDLDANECSTELSDSGGDVMAASITADGRRAVTATQAGVFSVWDLDTGQQLPLSPTRIVSLGGEQESGLLNVIADLLQASEEAEKTALQESRLVAVSVSEDQSTVAATSGDFLLHLLDLRNRKKIADFTGDAPFVTCAIMQDGTCIVALDKADRIHFLTLEV